MSAPKEVRDLIEKRRASIGGGERVPKQRELMTTRERGAIPKHKLKKLRDRKRRM